MQTTLVILIVSAAAAYLAYQAYLFFRPRPNGKACGGNCCDSQPAPVKASGNSAPRTQMISSDDLRNRLKARKA